jgi:hypothetical protein
MAVTTLGSKHIALQIKDNVIETSTICSANKSAFLKCVICDFRYSIGLDVLFL